MRDNCVNISDVSSLTPSFCSVSTFNTLLRDAAHNVVAHSDAALRLSGPGARVLQWQVSRFQPHEELGLGEIQGGLVGGPQDELPVLMHQIQL